MGGVRNNGRPFSWKKGLILFACICIGCGILFGAVRMVWNRFLKSPVVVVLASDQRYVPFLGVTLTSLIAHISEDNRYRIYVLSHGISDTDQERLRSIAAKKPQAEIRFIDVETEIRRIQALRFPTDRKLSAATYLRFFITELLPNEKKVVYLDSDLIVMTDIAELFATDMRGGVLWAAGQTPGGDKAYADLRGAYMKKHLGIDETSLYFNAGVLLIDIEAAKRDRFTDKLIGLMQKIKNPLLYDQDILNAAYALDGYRFSYLYNFEVQFSSTTEPAPYIIHFSGRKPWLTSWPEQKRKSFFDALFWKYAAQSPYRDELWRDVADRFCLSDDLFIHSKWEAHLRRLSRRRIERCPAVDQATIVKETADFIRLKWDNWGEETFVKTGDGVYTFKKETD